MPDKEKTDLAEAMGKLIADLPVEQALDILSVSVAYRIVVDCESHTMPGTHAAILRGIFVAKLTNDIAEGLDAMNGAKQ